ncbi:MAG: ferredoxin family protein [Lachnospiraceae bacterium]|nr:ferredoxin family protein [Lachnospiraceae bacterium]MBP5249764.1 ferredoxin family protein [Lachnospiraceae bacterium]
MSVRINKDKCVGCGRCAEVCPGTLIAVRDGKAGILYPKDCWGCVSCVKECAVSAIEYFLGADIGGKGSLMTVKKEKNILHWIIKKYDGTTEIIDIDSKDANKY